MIDISIIIVNWNARKFLKDCLLSIYEHIQTLEIEIFVIDNGSTDGSIQMIKGKFPHVFLIENNSNLGFAKANNIGISKSVGRYICLVNSDIVVKDECFSNLFKYMDENKIIGVIAPQLLNSDLSVQPSCKQFPTLWNNITRTFFLHQLFPKSSLFSAEEMNYFNHESIIKVDALAGAFLMVRREAFNQVGILDENFFIYSEDIDWCKRFWDKGWQVVFFPKVSVVHHDGGSSKIMPTRFYLEMVKAKLHYWKKHHSLVGRLLIHLIMFVQQVIRIFINLIFYIVLVDKRKDKYEEINRRIKALGLIAHSFQNSW